MSASEADDVNAGSPIQAAETPSWDAAGGRYVDVGGYVDVGKRGCRTSVVTVPSHYSSHLRDQGQSASILNTNGIYKNQAEIDINV